MTARRSARMLVVAAVGALGLILLLWYRVDAACAPSAAGAVPAACADMPAADRATNDGTGTEPATRVSTP